MVAEKRQDRDFGYKKVLQLLNAAFNITDLSPQSSSFLLIATDPKINLPGKNF